ncbi:C-type lectin domain family 4 member A [Microtus ochrogaster]|uniref:C-type lectin domain family 4 member A n=1 Tax=Microtus ochrogaster TaxID=79684 RepID=A0A8J6L391_MICOH|nr:C-type lectin domain family 4 member A [Microtus ochrogaster]
MFFLLLAVLSSVSLNILFQMYSDLLEEKDSIKQLNHTELDCIKDHPSEEDKVWSCCPKDWEPLSSHCYFIPTDSASWSKSEEKCSSMGAHLLVVHSREEQDFITKILILYASYFIGLSDPGHRQWRWVDQTPYNESATFWHPAPPKKTTTHESCLRFSRVLFILFTIYFLLLTILFSIALINKVWSCCPKDWESFSSHCYFIPTDAASWSKSQEKCSSMGAHLMVVHSREEQDFITKILNRNTAYFIGLSDPGHRQWRWVDQTSYNESATFWHPGEPSSDHEQCVTINRRSYSRSSWGWNDIPCSDTQRSVCQMKKIYL